MLLRRTLLFPSEQLLYFQWPYQPLLCRPGVFPKRASKLGRSAAQLLSTPPSTVRDSLRMIRTEGPQDAPCHHADFRQHVSVLVHTGAQPQEPGREMPRPVPTRKRGTRKQTPYTICEVRHDISVGSQWLSSQTSQKAAAQFSSSDKPDGVMWQLCMFARLGTARKAVPTCRTAASTTSFTRCALPDHGSPFQRYSVSCRKALSCQQSQTV